MAERRESREALEAQGRVSEQPWALAKSQRLALQAQELYFLKAG